MKLGEKWLIKTLQLYVIARVNPVRPLVALFQPFQVRCQGENAMTTAWLVSNGEDDRASRGCDDARARRAWRLIRRRTLASARCMRSEAAYWRAAFHGPARRSTARPSHRLHTRSRRPFPTSSSIVPFVLVSAKGTDRLFLGQLMGRVFRFRTTPVARRPTLHSTLPSSIPI